MPTLIIAAVFAFALFFAEMGIAATLAIGFGLGAVIFGGFFVRESLRGSKR